ncbi:MAG: 4-aminobutyrate aminotransferase, partial [Labilithrix sp.]|nr:4-aminobutyrate aminotransferase [Labilithrix sp.]
MSTTKSSQPRDQRAHVETAIPGPKSRALRAREDEHIAPGLQGYAVTSGIVVDHARGSTVTDVDGNTLLDFVGGIGVNAFGHSHPSIVSAIQAQVARASVASFTSEARVDLVERLARHRPAPGVHRVQLYSSGS